MQYEARFYSTARKERSIAGELGVGDQLVGDPEMPLLSPFRPPGVAHQHGFLGVVVTDSHDGMTASEHLALGVGYGHDSRAFDRIGFEAGVDRDSEDNR